LGIVRLVALIGGLWAAGAYHVKLAQWLAFNWGWADTLAQMLKPLVKLPGPFNNQEILRLPVGLLQQISKQIPLPSPWPEILAQLGQAGPNHTLGQAMNLLLAQGILKITAFIGIFLITKWIIGLLGSVAAAVLRFSPLGLLDRLVGLFLGLATGAVLILVIMTVLVPLQLPLALLGVEGKLGTLAKGINNSYFIAYFGPLVQSLGLIPPLLPGFSREFLFKNFHGVFGTQV